MYKLIVIIILCNCFLTKAQNNTFFLGHSLVNFNVPNMVHKLSIDASKNFSYKLNIGNGAGLKMHWTQPHSAGSQADWWDTTLNKGGFNNFILTEAVPLLGHLNWNDTYKYADSFYQFAKTYSPNIQYYLYETWHCINSGTAIGCAWDDEDSIAWRPRLNYDLPKWEGIADFVNTQHIKPMLIIPAGQGMALLYDSIVAGKLNGINNIQQLFSDEIHLNDIGNYFIACIMYAIIHKESPLGLTNLLTDPWGTPYTNYPTNLQATTLQNTAWQIVCNYNRDGVNCNPNSFTTYKKNENFIFPNPSNGQINFKYKDYEKALIINQLGEIVGVYNSNDSIYMYEKGIYFAKLLYKNNNEVKLLKIVVR